MKNRLFSHFIKNNIMKMFLTIREDFIIYKIENQEAKVVKESVYTRHVKRRYKKQSKGYYHHSNQRGKNETC